MFEELLETMVSPWLLIAAVALGGTSKGRQLVRSAAKEVIKAGMVASDRLKEIAAEVQEEASDVVAEVKAERKEQHKAEKAHQKAAAS